MLLMGGLGVEVLGLADGSVSSLLEARIILPHSLMWAGDSEAGVGSMSIDEANELVGRAADTVVKRRPLLARVEGGMDRAIGPITALHARDRSCGTVGRGGGDRDETGETTCFAAISGMRIERGAHTPSPV